MAYMEELAKALRHEDPELRVRVANALKELEDPRATMPLIEALSDPCGDVSKAAARARHHTREIQISLIQISMSWFRFSRGVTKRS